MTRGPGTLDVVDRWDGDGDENGLDGRDVDGVGVGEVLYCMAAIYRSMNRN